jgi:hypothetical protein
VKALFLRVGIDKGCGGCLAPIYHDGSFEYIPIPEEQPTSENRTYKDLQGRKVESLASLLPARLHQKFPHFDPEFETFTYGDPAVNKSRQLLRLSPGDLLVFYAGLKPYKSQDPSRLYIIGYFTISHIHNFNENAESPDKLMIAGRLRNNAHMKRINRDRGLVIAEGDPARSILLRKALPFGDSRNRVLQDLVPVFGFEGSILRAVGRWVNSSHIGQLKRYLNMNPYLLVGEDT